ncbi:hypothetical protein CXB49_11000 [Chromobacterium sp. ATCC 53434]|uniref:RHS repeat-associated core domain-containing protein n=1 Tax=Chromobacterium TaxID=535 RepID=UPI000C77D150|nr:RHS repeat-associated core domain-containing protein [Chromobacterium sp. ATCC 53434]AUH51303.1 hypothetical protein CXB49_11000 [Chromobacterium sp. ATCC 53434]
MTNGCAIGCHGERLDPVGGVHHLGLGHRAYSPALMRFHCPDSLSPFGAGGVNPYAYCDGDPINRADPSGQFSVGGAIGIGLGALGVLLTPVSFGTTLAAALSIGAVVAGVASVGLGIAAEAVDDRKLADKLGWTSVAVGVIGGIASVAVGRLALKAGALAGAAGSRLPGSIVHDGGNLFVRSLPGRLAAYLRSGGDGAAASIEMGAVRRASSTPDMAAFLALPEEERLLIARGAQGAVYNVSEHWVVKQPVPGSGGAENIPNLQREARAFRMVYGGKSALVAHDMLWMRKIPGRRVISLDLPRGEYRRIAQRIDVESKRLEKMGVYHGDPHGGNVLIDVEGVVRFVDFGKSTLREPPV